MAQASAGSSFVRGTLLPFLRAVQAEPSGLGAAGVVGLVCALYVFVVWDLLGLPPRLIGLAIPDATCTRFQPGTPQMYACSMGVAGLVVAGPLLSLVLVYVVRRALTRLAGWVARKLPEEARFLLAPLVATTVFGMCWSGMHPQTAEQVGLLPQRWFPGVVGLFTHLVARFGPLIQRLLGAFFDLRERYPVWQRFVAATGVPMLLALLLTAQERVSETALKEQVVVLVALATGYLALAPRRGDLVAGVRQALRREGAAPVAASRVAAAAAVTPPRPARATTTAPTAAAPPPASVASQAPSPTPAPPPPSSAPAAAPEPPPVPTPVAAAAVPSPGRGRGVWMVGASALAAGLLVGGLVVGAFLLGRGFGAGSGGPVPPATGAPLAATLPTPTGAAQGAAAEATSAAARQATTVAQQVQATTTAQALAQLALAVPTPAPPPTVAPTPVPTVPPTAVPTPTPTEQQVVAAALAATADPLARGEWDVVIDALGPVLARYPRSAEARERLYTAYFRKGRQLEMLDRPVEARLPYESAVALDPSRSEANARLALVRGVRRALTWDHYGWTPGAVAETDTFRLYQEGEAYVLESKGTAGIRYARSTNSPRLDGDFVVHLVGRQYPGSGGLILGLYDANPDGSFWLSYSLHVERTDDQRGWVRVRRYNPRPDTGNQVLAALGPDAPLFTAAGGTHTLRLERRAGTLTATVNGTQVWSGPVERPVNASLFGVQAFSQPATRIGILEHYVFEP